MRDLMLCLLAALAVIIGGPVMAAPLHYSGEVTYRERIALPDGATLRVTMVDLAQPDGKSVVGAAADILTPGQVPLQFALDIRSDITAGTHHYGLVAEIYADGQLWFRTPAPLPVELADTSGLLLMTAAVPPEEANLLVVVPDQPTEPPTPPGLFDTVWQVQSIGGNAVHDGTAVSFSIAADRRVGGNGGCNNYFTEASVDGEGLGFGAVAATRMACAPDVMVQEAALFAALANVTGYRMDGDQLDLLGTDGQPLLHMAPAH